MEKSTMKDVGYLIGKYRGKGGFGEVRECTRISDEQKFAVKMIRFEHLND